ncbi:MAG: LicD family protein [Erysipelotrichaceae bacterium]|nr:LicD family protein [Erysipelotrichaceae bacterium]
MELTDHNGHTYSLERLQERMLGILKYIDSVARKNGIPYYLAYGTLIGAVRHHGFIPWDDDADILITRDNYYRLIDAIVSDNDQRYQIMSLVNNKDWYTSCARVVDTHTRIGQPFSRLLKDHHVFVDIMPLDGMPEGDLVCKFHFTLMSFYKIMAQCADHQFVVDYERFPTIKKILKPFASIMGARYWGEKADRLARKRNYNTSRLIGYGTANHKEGEITKDAYASTLDCDFCDTKLMIPVGYDEILTSQYGDYMQLPPENKRMPIHIYDIYDLGED